MLQSCEGKIQRRMKQSVWSDSDEFLIKAEHQGEGYYGSVSGSQGNREDMWQERASANGHKLQQFATSEQAKEKWAVEDPMGLKVLDGSSRTMVTNTKIPEEMN